MGELIKEFTARAFARLAQEPDASSPWTKTPLEGLEMVKDHLASTYGVTASSIEELDAGVFKAGGFITRVFSAARPVDAVEGDAAVLRHLEEQGFPSERVVGNVSTLDGRGVLVTGFIEGAHAGNDLASIERTGELLGRLHALPLPGDERARRPAGSWHHVSHAGGPRSADAVALRPLLEEARSPDRSPVHLSKHFDSLVAELDAIDDGADLPQALIHIDLGGPNVIETPDGDLVAIDWAGAGIGARITSLAALAATDGDPKLVEAFVTGYRKHVQLEPEELDRLAGAIRAHSLVLDAWMMVFAPAYANHVVDGLAAKRAQSETIAGLVREAYSAPV